VGVLKELARASLVEKLNDVSGLGEIRESDTGVHRSLKERLTCQIQGQKTLILDPTLAGPLGLVTEVAQLKVRTGCCQ
jgi:hypothetical protein